MVLNKASMDQRALMKIVRRAYAEPPKKGYDTSKCAPRVLLDKYYNIFPRLKRLIF
jgi:hypothetical protein